MINNDVKTECAEKNMWKLLAEIDRLNKENENLRIENIQLTIDNELLHNSITNQSDAKEFLNNEGGFTDEEFDQLADAYKEYGFTC